MASKIKVTPQKEEMEEKEGPEIPLLDLSDAAVKKVIRNAKKRGYVTHDQINALLSSEEVKSDQIEDILAKLSEMWRQRNRDQEAELEETTKRRRPARSEEEAEGENTSRSPATVGSCQVRSQGAAERTDDPVRMYFREMGSVELLARG